MHIYGGRGWWPRIRNTGCDRVSVSYKFNGANLGSLNTQFLDSVAQGQVERAESYLKRHANINARNPDEDTALLHAVRTNDVPMALMLIDNKASLEAKDADGVTALIVAIRNNNVELCRALIDAGANVFVEDRDRVKAFDYAMRTRNAEIVNLFAKPMKEILERIPSAQITERIRASQRVDDIDPASGHTMLTWAAAEKGQEGLAAAFIGAGANLKATNAAGKTAMDVARETGNSRMQRLLEEAQGKPSF